MGGFGKCFEFFFVAVEQIRVKNIFGYNKI